MEEFASRKLLQRNACLCRLYITSLDCHEHDSSRCRPYMWPFNLLSTSLQAGLTNCVQCLTRSTGIHQHLLLQFYKHILFVAIAGLLSCTCSALHCAPPWTSRHTFWLLWIQTRGTQSDLANLCLLCENTMKWDGDVISSQRLIDFTNQFSWSSCTIWFNLLLICSKDKYMKDVSEPCGQ